MGNTWQILERLHLSNLSRTIIYSKISKYLQETPVDIALFQEATQYTPLGIKTMLTEKGLQIIPSVQNWSSIQAANIKYFKKGIVPLKAYPLPKSNGFLKPIPSECQWVEYKVNNTRLRIYNCQLQIRGIGIKERLAILEKIMTHSKSLKYPVVVCGDMNTTITKSGIGRKFIQFIHNEPSTSMYDEYLKCMDCDERVYFSKAAAKYGFQDVVPLNTTTWALPYTSLELFDLKLDWFFVKNIQYQRYELGPYITDHRPIITKLIL